ncbi:MAG: PASTA domain-containing protein [Planctomycetota bacterium]|jgi:beta-lactam-binding protein with PASTA domain
MRTIAIALVAASCLCFFAEPADAEDLVPEVVGLQLDEARGMIEKAGCTVTVTWRADHPPGIVVSQTPGGLAPKRPGMTVRITVGGTDPGGAPMPAAPTPTQPAPSTEPAPTEDLGPPTPGPGPLPPTPGPGPLPPIEEPPAPAPELAGVAPDRAVNRAGPALPSALSLTEAQARQTLSRWRVNLEQTIGLPQFVGRVVNQAPNPGETLGAGETVTIVVAVADPPSQQHRAVPTLTGMAMASAAETVRRAGFAPTLRSVPSSGADRGRVVEQSPLAGSLAMPGSEVRLRVGRGGQGGPAPVAPEPTAPPEPAPPTEPGPPTPGPGPLPPVEEPPTPGVAPPTPSQLSKPTLISPSEGQSFPRAYGSTFQWTQVPGATLYEWQLQREDRDGVWQIVATERVEGSRYRPARLERGSFRWRVRALGNGVEGQWSSFFRLYLY